MGHPPIINMRSSVRRCQEASGHVSRRMPGSDTLRRMRGVLAVERPRYGRSSGRIGRINGRNLLFRILTNDTARHLKSSAWCDLDRDCGGDYPESVPPCTPV